MTRRLVIFLGVTTGASRTSRLWSRWMESLGIDAALEGVDLPLDAQGHEYRKVVERLRDDPHSAGAVITSHKMNLFRHCRALLAAGEPLVDAAGEVACITKEQRGLVGHAIDLHSAPRALDEFFAPDLRRGAHALVFGAGGAGLAVVVSLLRPPGAARVVVADTRRGRLDHLVSVCNRLGEAGTVVAHRVRSGRDADRLIAAMPAGSLVVNATGLGKDAPGSPVTEGAVWPRGAVVWDLNYRGELTFLRQARDQPAEHALSIHDGWRLFLYGWAESLSLIFRRDVSARDLEEA